MKVLSYLEFSKDSNWDKWHIYTQLETNQQYKHILDLKELGLIKWYSKRVGVPFKPELITELFAGWGCDVEDDSYWFRNNHDKINYARSEMGGYIQYDSTLMNQTFDIPRTLDDFITDCQRAGIELVWR